MPPHLTELLWLKLENFHFFRAAQSGGSYPVRNVNFTIPELTHASLCVRWMRKAFAIATVLPVLQENHPPTLSTIGNQTRSWFPIRVSLGINNTEEQINRFVESIPVVIGKIRES